MRYDNDRKKISKGLIYMGSLPAENIYQRLSDLRNGTGKSQKEVADDLGIQASVLSRIERGETKAVSHDLVIKLAKYYNVSTDYLLCISDVRIRKNIELEELGLSNGALLLLLQGKLNGKMLSRMIAHPYFPTLLDTANSYFTGANNVGYANRNAVIDMGTMNLKGFMKNNPEHRIDAQHGIREINAQKIIGAEADLEKIKSIFMAMLKDIKKEYDVPQEDISTIELKQQLKLMNEQALMQQQESGSLNEENMLQLLMGIFSMMDLDEYELQKMQELTIHILKRLSDENVN